MSTISNAFKKDRRAYFLVELDFDGWKHRISTSDQQIENAAGDPLLFQGLIKNQTLSIGSSFDFRSFRYSGPTVRIQMINTDRFQDNEIHHKLDAGTATIWLWSPSLDWTDIEDYPIYRGGVQKTGGRLSDTYSLDIVDFTLDRGQVINSFSQTGHPAEILRVLLANKTRLAADHVDLGSVGGLRSVLPGWEFTSTVDAAADAFDVVDRVARQCWCARWQRHGRVGIVVLDPNGPAVGDLRDADFIGQAGEVFDSTPRDWICNSVSAKYNYSGGSFGDTLTVDHTNNELCGQSLSDYGAQPQLSLSLADIDSGYQARASVCRRLEFLAFRHDLFSCHVPYWRGWDLYEGDVALITHADGPSTDGAGWDRERCILLDRKFNRTGINQTWWRIDV